MREPWQVYEDETGNKAQREGRCSGAIGRVDYEYTDGYTEWLEEQLTALQSQLTTMTAERDKMVGGMQKIKDWCNAYPLEIFPEPDFEAVRDALKFYGLSLDAVSASNMRHVINGLKDIIDKAKGGE